MDSENLQKEFKVFNITIESLSVFYGIFLIGWGVVISLISGSSSLTSYIPSFLGVHSSIMMEKFFILEV